MARLERLGWEFPTIDFEFDTVPNTKPLTGECLTRQPLYRRYEHAARNSSPRR
jgi:hypothetical protein